MRLAALYVPHCFLMEAAVLCDSCPSLCQNCATTAANFSTICLFSRAVPAESSHSLVVQQDWILQQRGCAGGPSETSAACLKNFQWFFVHLGLGKVRHLTRIQLSRTQRHDSRQEA